MNVHSLSPPSWRASILLTFTFHFIARNSRRLWTIFLSLTLIADTLFRSLRQRWSWWFFKSSQNNKNRSKISERGKRSEIETLFFIRKISVENQCMIKRRREKEWRKDVETCPRATCRKRLNFEWNGRWFVGRLLTFVHSAISYLSLTFPSAASVLSEWSLDAALNCDLPLSLSPLSFAHSLPLLPFAPKPFTPHLSPALFTSKSHTKRHFRINISLPFLLPSSSSTRE